ncbi:serine/threonine protein kinase psk1 [Thelotrema lepadinum]|nr:serine/threonine protein kinase psk1 [Thelotrema lepadinum]
MSSTQTETENGLAPPCTGFKMERSESEIEPRLGRSPYRSFEYSSSTPQTNSHAQAEPVHILLHPDDEMEEKKHFDEHFDMDATAPLRNANAVSMARTPSIPIAMTQGSRSISRARDTMDKTPTGNVDVPLTGKAKRKKKKARKQPPTSAPSPAMQTVRGFTPTRVPSSDGDSDFSPHRFQRRDISVNTSLASSPLMRPISRGSVTGGISALRQQLDSLDLEPVPGNPGLIRNKSKTRAKSPSTPGATTGSGTVSDVEPLELESYEVPLNEDFVSKDAEPQEEEDPFTLQMDLDVMHRKMTAADFTPLTCLGKGTFGTVHLVKQRATGRLFAQKMFRKASLTVQKTLIEQTKTERAILESVNRHPFVVKLYYAFQDQEKLYLILEYAQGGELFTHLAAEHMFPEDTASFYMAEMVLALSHLHHTVGVVYRDLKPENCLLDSDGHLLLTDFGLSKVAVEDSSGESTRCSSFLGTIEYMAPEVILGHTYDRAVDWWSFGALGFDLLTGAPPFQGANHSKIQEKIVKSKLMLPYFLSPDAKDLLTRLLRKEPRKRLGSSMPKDLVTIKKHRFFRKLDWKRLEKRELEPPIRPLVTDPELAENFAAEFTGLALSPVVESHPVGGVPWDVEAEEGNPFGGFSFVASKSLFLGEGGWGVMEE